MQPRSMTGRGALAALLVLLAIAAGALAAVQPAHADEGEMRVAATGFSDVPDGHWVASGGWLDYVLENGLMGGTAPQLFSPEDDITRAQVVTILYRFENPESDATTVASAFEDNATAFADVAARAYYTAAVNWASGLGVVTGVSATEFCPDDPVTREQLATILLRYLVSIAPSGFDRSAYSSAPDAGSVSPWAVDGISWALDAGVMSGVDAAGNLKPGDHASRGAMAKMITVTLRDALPAARATVGIAATVDGEEIAEQLVTNYIQNFRQANGLSDDGAWRTWLEGSGMTAESMRLWVINNYVEALLMNRAAEELGTSPSERALMASVVALYGVPSMDDAELLECLRRHADELEGSKRSSHVLFASSDLQTAQFVLGEINSGAMDFTLAVMAYSTDTGSAQRGGDVGWDVGSPFVSEYQEGLDALSPGQVSGLVESQFGYHIIKCTDEFAHMADVDSPSQVPEDLVDYALEREAYDTWWEAYQDAAQVTINLIPYGSSYDV